MQKILRKRIVRDFKSNVVRYMALFLLVSVGMYIVISLISVAEAVRSETIKNHQESNVEDGEFTLMVPLLDSDFSSVKTRGVTIEPTFYMDYRCEEDDSLLRIFQNRTEINQICLDEGRLAQAENEIVIEKVYAYEHHLSVGDHYNIAGRDFEITGIGSVVDYDEPLQEGSSVGADSSAFGLGFVSADMYEILRSEGQAVKSETYLYTYLLNGAMTDLELKKEIARIKPDLAQIQNIYIQEMIGTLKSTRLDLERGLKDLNSGINELSKGRNELQTGTTDIQKAANEFESGTNELSSGSGELKEATSELASGSDELLEGTGDLNDGAQELSSAVGEVSDGSGELGDGIAEFAEGANELNENADALASGIEELEAGYEELATYHSDIRAIVEELPEEMEEIGEALLEYVAGVETIGNGIHEAAAGSRQLQTEGTAKLASQVSLLSEGVRELQNALEELKAGSDELSKGTATLYENIGALKAGSLELDTGAGELVDGANEIHGYAREFNSSVNELQSGTNELSSGILEFQKGTGTLKSKADELIRDYLRYDIDNMTTFTIRTDNSRIEAANVSISVYKSAGIVMGIILFLLFGYVISVFVSHNIEKEGMVIGALYSMGVNKNELMLHYLTLPVILTFLGGICGTIIGFSPAGTRMQIASSETYYSIPYCPTVYPVYLVLYGILLPPLITIIVNYFIINNKLSVSALSLLKNEKKQSKLGRMKLGNLGFINRFRIRQFCKELRSGIAIMVGIFISLLLVILALDVYALCDNLVSSAREEIPYEYMYVYKYPSKIAPEGGDTFYVETLRKETYDENIDVSIWGMYHNNSYFHVETTKEKNKIVISEAVASKFTLSVGDIMTLTDSVEGVDHAFEVADIVPYYSSMSVFMDMSQMQELFGQSRDYYNVVLSRESLDIDPGRLYSTTTKADVIKAAIVTKNSIDSLIYAAVFVGAFVLIVVMYLMMKVAMDRAAFQISLMKIFGFRSKEIRKLYLDGNFFIVIFTLVTGIPLAKKIIDAIFPALVASMSGANNTSYSPVLYVGVFGFVVITYIVINWVLVRKIEKVTPAEVLKNRE